MKKYSVEEKARELKELLFLLIRRSIFVSSLLFLWMGLGDEKHSIDFFLISIFCMLICIYMKMSVSKGKIDE